MVYPLQGGAMPPAELVVAWQPMRLLLLDMNDVVYVMPTISAHQTKPPAASGAGDIVCIMQDAPARAPVKDGSNSCVIGEEMVCVMPAKPARPPPKGKVGSDCIPIVDLPPACDMPLPSLQPVVKTKGGLPIGADSKPRGPEFSIPLAIDRQNCPFRPTLRNSRKNGGNWFFGTMGSRHGGDHVDGSGNVEVIETRDSCPGWCGNVVFLIWFYLAFSFTKIGWLGSSICPRERDVHRPPRFIPAYNFRYQATQ